MPARECPLGLFRIEQANTGIRLARGRADVGPEDLLHEEWTIDTILGGDDATLLDQAIASPSAGPVPQGARLLAPIESQEVWAAGVTYLRSRDARVEESEDGDCYLRVYTATRPEIFFKAAGWRVRGPEQPVGIRADSDWDVPEPELGLVVNRTGLIVGYVIGNDVSSRSIEGANPLYLPQAKVYDGSCALGPCLVSTASLELPLDIHVRIIRDGQELFSDSTSTANLRRRFEELTAWLTASMAFPTGCILLTGTCLVPPDEITLRPGDTTEVEITDLGTLRNVVERVGTMVAAD
jgi:2-dehydro-3-deoxy-D-arabinonate dehydratase